MLKPSHSLDTTDVHTLLHISCFQQFLVSKLLSDSLVFLVFSVSLLVFFFGEDQAVQTFSNQLERERNQLVKMTIICVLTICEKNRYRRWAFNVSMYQCSILLHKFGFIQPEMNFGPENLNEADWLCEYHLLSQWTIFYQARWSRSRHPPDDVHNRRSTRNFWNVWNQSLVHEASYSRRVGSQHFWEKCNVRSIQDAHLKGDFILINHTFSQLRSTNDLDCCFMTILSLKNYEKTLEQYAWAYTG